MYKSECLLTSAKHGSVVVLGRISASVVVTTDEIMNIEKSESDWQWLHCLV